MATGINNTGIMTELDIYYICTRSFEQPCNEKERDKPIAVTMF